MKHSSSRGSLAAIMRTLAREAGRLRFGPPVAFVYNPLIYARRPHEEYIRHYGAAPKEVLLLGMNPGPFGMAQTGIPFGEVTLARDWLGLEAPVDKPQREHPKRPIQGFDCPRSEVSGRRLWGWVRDTFTTPQQFFGRFYIANYCPLCFIETGGRNITPDKLPAAEREPLLATCDRALRSTVGYLRPRIVIGIGGFAEQRARAALAGLDVKIGRMLHPSPASPLANRGWAAQARAAIESHGVKLP